MIMPWRKLLQITSKWHMMAVLFYAVQFAIGLVFTLEPSEPMRFVEAASGGWWARLWGLLLLAGGVLGIVSMFFKGVEEYLAVEFFASLIIGCMMWWAFTSMIVTSSPSKFGVLVVAYFAAAPLARSGQILYELWKVKRAKKAPVLTTAEEYLAAPEDK
jgi:hypothetical protein